MSEERKRWWAEKHLKAEQRAAMRMMDKMLAHVRELEAALRSARAEVESYAAQYDEAVKEAADALARVRELEADNVLANACIDALEAALVGSLEGRGRDTLEAWKQAKLEALDDTG